MRPQSQEGQWTSVPMLVGDCTRQFRFSISSLEMGDGRVSSCWSVIVQVSSYSLTAASRGAMDECPHVAAASRWVVDKRPHAGQQLFKSFRFTNSSLERGNGPMCSLLHNTKIDFYQYCLMRPWHVLKEHPQ
jgi:hypothetical protein